MSYTLLQLRNKVKRHVRLLRATTGASVEAESGNDFADNAIDDAINAGRKQLVPVVNAEKWLSSEATFVTVSNIQEYSLADSVIAILAVQYNVTSGGARQSSTVDAVDVKTRKGEEWAIGNGMDTPSATNPKYRVTNKGIKIITSTDGTQAASIYVRVEYLKEPTDLSSDDGTSDIPGTLDEIVVSWATYLLCRNFQPELSTLSYRDYLQQVNNLNRRL